MPSDDEVERVARQTGGGASSEPPPAPSVGGPFDHQLTDMVIDEATGASMTNLLEKLVKDAHASSGMVLDRAGQIIVWNGIDYKEEATKLGALIAGAYASTREMARILGEQNFRTLLQEGAREKIYTEAVGEHWLVVVIFGHHTHLGLVKILCDRASADLADVLVRAVAANRTRSPLLDATLQRVTQDTIDLIFRDES